MGVTFLPYFYFWILDTKVFNYRWFLYIYNYMLYHFTDKFNVFRYVLTLYVTIVVCIT